MPLYTAICQSSAFLQSFRDGRIVTQASNRKGLRRNAHFSLEFELPPTHIQPGSCLMADTWKMADFLKTHLFVQSDTGRIGQRDAGDNFRVALQPQNREQACVKCP